MSEPNDLSSLSLFALISEIAALFPQSARDNGSAVRHRSLWEEVAHRVCPVMLFSAIRYRRRWPHQSTADVEDAEDAVSDTFVLFAEKVHSGDFPPSLVSDDEIVSWLERKTVQFLNTAYKRARRRSVRPLPPDDRLPAKPGNHQISDAIELLTTALNRDVAECFRLRSEGRKLDEIAGLLQKSRSSVARNLDLAIEFLQEHQDEL